ncbi:MAG TPA: hypothetical protein VJ436_04965 [Anaerolineales bacterium]|nr:hypothetical protein [Anaerolineales bacterium]
MKKQLTLSQAIAGYELAAQARRLNIHTLADYGSTFRKFQQFLDEDILLSSVKPDQVKASLAGQLVSKKTLLNYHTGLSALWTWAVAEGLAPEHSLRGVERSKPEEPAVLPSCCCCSIPACALPNSAACASAIWISKTGAS